MSPASQLLNVCRLILRVLVVRQRPNLKDKRDGASAFTVLIPACDRVFALAFVALVFIDSVIARLLTVMCHLWPSLSRQHLLFLRVTAVVAAVAAGTRLKVALSLQILQLEKSIVPPALAQLECTGIFAHHPSCWQHFVGALVLLRMVLVLCSTLVLLVPLSALMIRCVLVATAGDGSPHSAGASLRGLRTRRRPDWLLPFHFYPVFVGLASVGTVAAGELYEDGKVLVSRHPVPVRVNLWFIWAKTPGAKQARAIAAISSPTKRVLANDSYQYINISIYQYINISIYQYINISIYQYINISIY
eukprot:SAG31_NODE_8466_length_1446_cov_1.190794_1_plen_303_part_10